MLAILYILYLSLVVTAQLKLVIFSVANSVVKKTNTTTISTEPIQLKRKPIPSVYTDRILIKVRKFYIFQHLRIYL